MKMNIRYATISETGKRWNNEDVFRVLDMPESNRWMGVVCDGMGGHSKGEVASETIADAVIDYWRSYSVDSDSEEKVKKLCDYALQEMDKKADTLGHCHMGTTMVLASIEGDTVTIAHVGDSRCYLQRPDEGLLYQTKDHIRLDFGWELVSRCFFSYQHDIHVPDVAQFKVQPGDRLLLCSDGLYKSMTSVFLLERMMEQKPLEDILHEYDAVCRERGDDNYTAILIEIQ